MVDYLDKINTRWSLVKSSCLKVPILFLALYGFIAKAAYASYFSLDIISTLNNVQQLLMHIGPMLSAALFVLGGIFYAIGQLFPSYKRASLHTMAIDIIIGAIVVAVLSVASTNLAIASTHLLSNLTSNSL
jgi:hypothetical protein